MYGAAGKDEHPEQAMRVALTINVGAKEDGICLGGWSICCGGYALPNQACINCCVPNGTGQGSLLIVVEREEQVGARLRDAEHGWTRTQEQNAL